MGTVRVSLADLPRQFARDMRRLQKSVVSATQRTARKGVPVVQKNAPEAWGEIREGIIARSTSTGAVIDSTAPHSAPVEGGSRPHMPPVDAIEKWVKLRGMQGITNSGSLRRGAGVNIHAQDIAARIRARTTRGNRKQGRSTEIDVARQLAWEIALAIKKHGTKPTFFMKRSVPIIEVILDIQINVSLDRL
jgi:hypothetical protein